MQWQRLDRGIPVDGTKCVVGHFTSSGDIIANDIRSEIEKARTLH